MRWSLNISHVLLFIYQIIVFAHFSFASDYMTSISLWVYKNGSNGYFHPTSFISRCQVGAGEHPSSSRWRLPVSPCQCHKPSKKRAEVKEGFFKRKILPTFIDTSSLQEEKKSSVETNLVNGDDKIGHFHLFFFLAAPRPPLRVSLALWWQPQNSCSP